MEYQKVFERHEIKYLINEEQYKFITNAINDYMKIDKYGRSLICNLYYDTDSYLLIRRSNDKPIYKEKFRIRSYGIPSDNSPVYLELKKKYQQMVYKRRILLTYQEVKDFISSNHLAETNQISKEINYCFNYYKNLKPEVYLAYERVAYYGLVDPNFRVTFDNKIIWRNYDLDLTKGVYGKELLPKGMYLMEIKTAKAIPLWLCHLLSEMKLYHTSFSKYGNAFRTIEENLVNKEKVYNGEFI